MPISAVSVGVGLLRVLRLITSQRVNNAILRSTMIGHPHWDVEARKRSMAKTFANTESILENQIESLVNNFRNGNRNFVIQTVIEATPANIAFLAARIVRDLGIHNRRVGSNDDANIFLRLLLDRATNELGPMNPQ